MKIGIFNGTTFLEIEDSDQIEKAPLVFGQLTINIGSTFEQLGSKERTSLKAGKDREFVYMGMCNGYVLLDIQLNTKQLTLFPENKRVYIAPIWVNENCLLMQSSMNGFYDIRP